MGRGALAQETTPADSLAAQLRSQGYACEAPVTAQRAPRPSQPDFAVWTLKCAHGSYRMASTPTRQRGSKTHVEDSADSCASEKDGIIRLSEIRRQRSLGPERQGSTPGSGGACRDRAFPTDASMVHRRPPGSYAKRTSPLISAARPLSISCDPKPRREGGCTGGPPLSCHVIRRRGPSLPVTRRHATSRRPAFVESAPYFAALVQSSCRVMAIVNASRGGTVILAQPPGSESGRSAVGLDRKTHDRFKVGLIRAFAISRSCAPASAASCP